MKKLNVVLWFPSSRFSRALKENGKKFFVSIVSVSVFSVINDWDCDIILLGLNCQFYNVVYVYIKCLGFWQCCPSGNNLT